MKRNILAYILVILLVLFLFPAGAQAADHLLKDGDSLDISTLAAGDTVTIGAGANVTLSGTQAVQIVCGAGVKLTLSDVTIDDSAITDACPISFSGGGNTLTMAAGTTNMLTGYVGTGSAAGAPGIRVASGTALTINGTGTLRSEGGDWTAGIGGGNGEGGGSITISSGNVTAQGGEYGAGIGGGKGGSGGSVSITGGKVGASNSGGGHDIGSGSGGGSGGTLNLDGAAFLYLYADGTDAAVNKHDVYIADNSSGITNGFYVNGTLFTGTEIVIGPGSITGDGASYGSSTVTISDMTKDYLIASETTDNRVVVSTGTAIATNIILFGTSIENSSGCAFDMTGSKVNLVLCGKSTLFSGDDYAGLQCPNGAAVTITGNGRLTATGGEFGAGIGGGAFQDGGNIVIQSGDIHAQGGSSGAGIGGGYGGSGGTIKISGTADVTSTGGGYAAGVGGGNCGVGGTADGGDIQISGGKVKASGGYFASGIGGGEHGAGGKIQISGGTMEAYGADYGSGIGGGNMGEGGNITISGIADVTAQGGMGAAGIGSGIGKSGGVINISGGKVTATGGANAMNMGAGIGGGDDGGSGDITISGGIVYATGAGSAKDIGNGSDGSGGTLSISGGAAVFMRNDSYITPVITTTHTHKTDNSYGITMPGSWTTFGAWLQLYTLSYSTNGDAGTVPASVTQRIGTTTTVGSADSYTRTGYTQGSGWNTKADGSGTSVSSGDTFTFNADTTLFARWTANAYEVKYDANGGTGMMADSSHTYDASKALTSNAFTRKNYTFAGWATSADGSVVYNDGQSVTSLTAANKGTVTLYARWKAQPALTASDADGKIITGGQVTLAPSVAGGTWAFDSAYFSREGGTFTALKAGISTITYTVDGVSVSYEATVLPALALTSSDADGKVFAGGRVTLTPSITGGTWTFDSAYFSREGGTFTALKAGTSTITYTVEGLSTTYAMIIEKSILPATGQNFAWVWVLGGAGFALALVLTASVRRKGSR